METTTTKQKIKKYLLVIAVAALFAVAFSLLMKTETKAQTLEGKNFVHNVPNGYTGFALDDTDTWYYFRNGRIAWGWYGLAQGVDGQWYFSNGGYVDWHVTGLAYHYGGWFYVDHGKVNWGANTLCQNPHGWWKVTNGVVDFNFTGLWQYNGTWYYLRNGCIDWGYYGLAQGWNGKWYFVNGGYIDWYVTGLCQYGYDYYYVDHGWVQWNYNGKAKLPGTNTEVDVVNSKAVINNYGGLSPQVAQKAKNVLNATGNNLWGAYQYSKMPYEWNGYSAGMGTNFFANYGLTHHRGNCYVMAATMVALAKRLGYEAYQVSGAVPSYTYGMSRHSWAMVKYEGQWYIFDPDFESEGHGSGWQIWYGKPGTWRYVTYSNMGM